MRVLVGILPILYFLFFASPFSLAAEQADVREYGPVAAGEGMWTIAGKTRPDKSVSHHQMMLALLRTNPDAFQYPCNLLSLRQGAMLKIPDLETIQSLSRAEALAEFKRQQETWKAHRKGRTLVCPEIEEPFPPAEKTDPAVENAAIPLAADASPAVPRTPPPLPPRAPARPDTQAGEVVPPVAAPTSPALPQTSPPLPPGEPASPDPGAEKLAAPPAAEASPALHLIPPPELEPPTGQGEKLSVGESVESPTERISEPRPVGTDSPAPIAPRSGERIPWREILHASNTLWALLLIGLLLLLWLGLRVEQGPDERRAAPVILDDQREAPAWLGEQIRAVEEVPPPQEAKARPKRPPPAPPPAAPEISLPPDSEAAALGAELDRLFAGQVFSPQKGEQADHFFEEADLEALPGDTAPPTEGDLDDILLAVPPRHSSLS